MLIFITSHDYTELIIKGHEKTMLITHFIKDKT